jgi:dTDP-4-amino-4,6-dideoxygalactose transaminase
MTPKTTPATTAVPMLDLKRQYATIRTEIQTAIDHVCESQHLVLGPEVDAFEKEMSQFLGTTDSVACASGTDALWLSLRACGVGPGDSVITTPFSFFATASAILRCGARPVFVDVDPQTLNLDPAAVSHRLENLPPHNVKAILPVHLYGQCADMDGLSTIAEEHKLFIVEDAAQAFGACWRGRRAGSLSRAAAFSFYPTKNLSAFGDAGAVSTSDTELAARMRSLRNHGSRVRYYHEEVGWNARMDGLQGAVLRVKLRHIEKWNNARRDIADLYDKLFVSAGLSAGRGNFAGDTPVKILATLPQAFHIFHQYVVRVPRRDELRKFLAERNIGSEVYYPVPLQDQQCLEYLGYSEGNLPNTDAAAKDVLALPIFPELTEEEAKRVVDGIAEFFNRQI